MEARQISTTPLGKLIEKKGNTFERSTQQGTLLALFIEKYDSSDVDIIVFFPSDTYLHSGGSDRSMRGREEVFVCSLSR